MVKARAKFDAFDSYNVEIKGLKGFLSQLNKVKTSPNNYTVYRGQQLDVVPTPRYLRGDFKLSEKEEQKIIYQCLKDVTSSINVGDRINLKNMIEAHTHGCSTRLIEWTGLPKIALFYATGESESSCSMFHVVWAMSFPKRWKYEDLNCDPFRLPFIEFIRSPFKQSSGNSIDQWFTIHPAIEKKRYLWFDHISNPAFHLARFIIPNTSCNRIRSELKRIGIDKNMDF